MKKSKKNDYFKYIIALIFFLAIMAISLFLFEKYYLDKKENSQEKIEIKDRCTLMLGNLIHQIKTENNCITICEQECEAKNKNYEKVEFLASEADCNTCNCYCI